MSFAKPTYLTSEVNRAGRVLASSSSTPIEIDWATDVLADWRACHLYPINTFQSTLRGRVGKIDRYAIVAQRLKRAPSFISKLRGFKSMNLSQV